MFNSTVIFDLFDLETVDVLRRVLTEAGATSFGIISYGNTEEDSIYNEAYRDAINSARQHAERLLASEAVAPGKILNLHKKIHQFAGVREKVQSPDKRVEINIGGDLALAVDPLYNKKFYTKEIVFNIEFELVKR